LPPQSESSFRRKPESRVPGENRDPVFEMVPDFRRDDVWMPPYQSTGQAPQVRHDGKRCLWTDTNYSQSGYYFITICTKNREEWFGKIENGEMVLNKYSEIVNKGWNDLPKHYLNCSLDLFVIMPNHVHGIIVIDDKNVVGNGLKPFPTKIINWR